MSERMADASHYDCLHITRRRGCKSHRGDRPLAGRVDARRLLVQPEEIKVGTLRQEIVCPKIPLLITRASLCSVGACTRIRIRDAK